MGALYSYKSPDGVLYICMGSSGPHAYYIIAPDGSFDPKAKAIADDFNNGGHSITIDGRTFKLPKKEVDGQNALDNETRKRIEEESIRIDKEKEKSRVVVTPEEEEEEWRRIEMAFKLEEILGRKLSDEELIKISKEDNLFALYNYYEEELNKNQKTSFWRKLIGY